MSKQSKPIDPAIKCPKCGEGYPTIRANGNYKRDNYEIPQYFCQRCQKSFSCSVIKIKFLKPQYEVEIGFKVKVEAEITIKGAFPIEKVSFAVIRDKGAIFEAGLIKQNNDIYAGIWDLSEGEAKKHKIVITAVDSGGYGSIKTKTVKVVQHYDNLIREIAPQFGLEPSLLKGMIWKESSFKPKVTSNKGAVGLTQLMPDTATAMGVVKADDPEQNIRGGAKYLKELIDKYDGKLRIALGAYNWGMGNVADVEKKEERFPAGVKKYITDILNLKKRCERDYVEHYETQ